MSPSRKPTASVSEKSLALRVSERHLPPSGWLIRARIAILPYLQLMRLDRPSGYWYFWYPHVYGTVLAAIKLDLPLQRLLEVNLVLACGVLIMRGATCTWNDTVDIEFDRRVSRCRGRPLARGAVSVTQANVFTAVQTILSLATLSLLPALCSIYAVPAIIGWTLYPLTKRVTYYPQVILGFPMAWGIFMGAASVGADPLCFHPVLKVITSAFDAGRFSLEPLSEALQAARIDWSLTSFYLGNAIWTLLYEVVYSHQDAAEDEAAGVRNLVLLYVNPKASTSAERYGTLPFLIRLAVAQVLCLVIAGALAGYSFVYGAMVVAGSAAALSTMLSRVRLEQPESCAWWFRVGNARYAGGAMLSGLIAELLARRIHR